MNDEPELRHRFAALRDEDAARIPSFEQVLRHARPRDSIRLRVLGVTACVIVALVSGIVLHSSQQHKPPALEAASLAGWRAPTDFLLQTPGRELLRSVPQIGEPAALVFPQSPSLDRSPLHSIGQEPHS